MNKFLSVKSKSSDLTSNGWKLAEINACKKKNYPVYLFSIFFSFLIAYTSHKRLDVC